MAAIALLVGPAHAQATPPQPAQHGANPTVSPDGRLIAFVSDRASTGDFYVMNADGSDVRRLTTDGGHKGRAYWSADGKHLMFSVPANDTAHVMSLSLGGGAAVEIARFGARSGGVPFADASRFVYGVGPWARVQLVVSRGDGSGQVPLTSDRAAYFCQAISPRGDQVAAARSDSSGMQIWVVNLDGSGARQVTRFSMSQGTPQCPSYSPDGRRVAVQSEVNDPADSTRQVGHVWVVDVATGDATRLAVHAEPYVDELPAWFPDGKRIVFQSDRTGRWEVWVMNADGTGQRQLTH